MSSKIRTEHPTDPPSKVKKAKKGESKEEFVFPSDWPARTGLIDLKTQDLPHASSKTEWWYINCHGKGSDGNEYSVFVSFFKSQDTYKVSKDQDNWCYSLVGAICDVANQKYYPIAVIDKTIPRLFRVHLENKSIKADYRFKRALLEVLYKGKFPAPDEVTPKSHCKMDKLDIGCGHSRFVKLDNGNYHAYVESEGTHGEKVFFEVELEPQKPVQRQGHEGLVQVGVQNETMFYYFIPRCAAKGWLKIGPKGQKIGFQGNGWYDHEFGGHKQAYSDGKDGEKDDGFGERKMELEKITQASEEEDEPEDEHYWDWLSVQLDDGTDISASLVYEGDDIIDKYVIEVHPDGKQTEYLDFSFDGSDSWISTTTTNEYMQTWVLNVPGKMNLTFKSLFPAQEVVTMMGRPGFWEGRLDCEGTLGKKKVKGIAFIEQSRFMTITSMDAFFKRISRITRKEIARVLPHKPDLEGTRFLVAQHEQPKFDHFMKGVDRTVLAQTICDPIRSVVDRGGKAWRSWALLLCIEAVGGSALGCRHWLVYPELLHVGSLIIDDVQDESKTRRGGPAVHEAYGDEIAINAGNAAYFVALDSLMKRSPDLSAEDKLYIYDLYFLTLRGGHCGQGFDIKGLDYLMPHVVETGDNTKLIEHLQCIHLLKSGGPAGCLARMGVKVGGGSQEQLDKIGTFFEKLGIAFQIVDDVLNLRGFEGNKKQRGEDIMAGKVTYPVARAMARMELKQRQWVYKTIQSKPQDLKVVQSVVDLLEEVGAVQEAADEARSMVEDAWKEVDSVLPDTIQKVFLRSFSWYVLDRHY